MKKKREKSDDLKASFIMPLYLFVDYDKSRPSLGFVTRALLLKDLKTIAVEIAEWLLILYVCTNILMLYLTHESVEVIVFLRGRVVNAI